MVAACVQSLMCFGLHWLDHFNNFGCMSIRQYKLLKYSSLSPRIFCMLYGSTFVMYVTSELGYDELSRNSVDAFEPAEFFVSLFTLCILCIAFLCSES